MAFTTRKSLLARVLEGGEIPWREFYATYKPLILLCGDDCGLAAEEKEELVQNVMCEIFQKDIIGKYDPDHVPDDVVFKHDPARGRFRHYLRKIIRYQAIRLLRDRRKKGVPFDENATTDEEGCIDAGLDNSWDEEWRRHVLNMTLAELKGRIKPEHYLAFEMYALQNRSVQEVAEFLGLSVAAVYTIKSRCIATLREIAENFREE